METGWLKKKVVKPAPNKITKYFGRKPSTKGTISGNLQRRISQPNECADPSNKCTGSAKPHEFWISERNMKKDIPVTQNAMVYNVQCTTDKEEDVPNIGMLLQNKEKPLVKLPTKQLHVLDKSDSCNSVFEADIPLSHSKADELSLHKQHCNARTNFNYSSNLQSEDFVLSSKSSKGEREDNCAFSLNLNSQTAHQLVPFVPVSIDTDFTLCSPHCLNPETEGDNKLNERNCNLVLPEKEAEECEHEIEKIADLEVQTMDVLITSPLKSKWNDSLDLENAGPIMPIRCREIYTDFTLSF